VALLEQKLELQRAQISEHKEQAKMQKDLYDTMVNAIESTNNPNASGETYLAMIKNLEEKHEQHLKETVTQYTERCENLYSYIKDAEKLLDDMDLKRKRERREAQRRHEREISQLHQQYKEIISHLKQRISK